MINSRDKRVSIALSEEEVEKLLRLGSKEGLSKSYIMDKIHHDILESGFLDKLKREEPRNPHHYRTTKNNKVKLENKCEELNLSVSAVFRMYLATLEET